LFENPIYFDSIYIRVPFLAFESYYMRLYYLGEMIANRELNMDQIKIGIWQRLDFPPSGMAKVDRIVFSQGLELDVMKFSQRVQKKIPYYYSSEDQSIQIDV